MENEQKYLRVWCNAEAVENRRNVFEDGKVAQVGVDRYKVTHLSGESEVIELGDDQRLNFFYKAHEAIHGPGVHLGYCPVCCSPDASE